MKKKILYIIFSLAFIVGLSLSGLAGMESDSFRIPTSVISGGGTPMSSDSFKTDSTLGQSSPLMDPYDPPISTNYDLYPGFWYTVEAKVPLPVVSVTLTPDTTTVPRGGTLGFQATATNNTNKTGTVYFATKVRLPNGKMYPYPPSDYLYGPLKFTLGPYKSKSGHLNQNIPTSAPLGTYIYYGYVHLPGVGIVDEDQFEFEVTAANEAEGAEEWETEVDEEFGE